MEQECGDHVRCGDGLDPAEPALHEDHGPIIEERAKVPIREITRVHRSHGVADSWIHRNAGHHETIEEGSDLVHDATGTRTFVKGWSMGPRL